VQQGGVNTNISSGEQGCCAKSRKLSCAHLNRRKKQMSVQAKHQALIYVMVLISAANRDMTDRELFTIGEIVKTLPVFDGLDIEKLPEIVENCAKLLSNENGQDQVIGFASDKLPARLRETAYALACDMAAASDRLHSEKIRLLELLRHKLEIGQLPAAAIERGAKARYQTI
jgi:hypothetical protein